MMAAPITELKEHVSSMNHTAQANSTSGKSLFSGCESCVHCSALHCKASKQLGLSDSIGEAQAQTQVQA